MPRGSTHTETGRLNRTPYGWVLRRDGGGRWRLDLGLRAAWRARGLEGKRVRVEGTRAAFDLLDVRSLVAID